MRGKKSKRRQAGLCGAGAALLLLGAPQAADAGDIFYVDWTAPGNENFLDDQIWTVNFDGSGKVPITTPGQILRPIGLDADVANQHLYYGSGGAGAPGFVGRVNFDGTNHQQLVTLASGDDAQHVRLDLTNGKIYWIGYYSGVHRANLDGTGAEVVIDDPSIGSYTRLALDVPNNAIYFGDYGGGAGNMWRTDLNGGGFTPLAAKTPGANDLALDNASNRFYWANAGGSIQSVLLDGTDTQTLVSGLGTPLGIDLTPDGSQMVWTERGGQRIAFANIDGSSPQTITTAGNPFGVVVVPEPGTAMVLFLAGGALLVRRRRMEC